MIQLLAVWSRSWRHATDHGEIAKVIQLRDGVPQVQFLRVRPCDMQRWCVCLATVAVPPIQFIVGVTGHSSSQQNGLAPFFALLLVELSAHFSAPSMVKMSLPSRAPLPISTGTCGHSHLDSLQHVSETTTTTRLGTCLTCKWSGSCVLLWRAWGTSGDARRGERNSWRILCCTSVMSCSRALVMGIR